MQHFQESAFQALPANKAKAAALALFDAAMIEPAADWRGVAFALHSVVSRKRGAAAGAVSDDVAMQDHADAREFTPWADYPATGKAASIARGRVTVTFADGWTKTVGMLAGKTAKGRKPWSIAAAVRFAVVCYKIAAVRRATGSDAALYHGDATLDSLVSCPEIVAVESADSSETVAGDLVWNPCEANAATREHRAGRVDLATYSRPTDAPFNDEPCALEIARRAMLREMGKLPTPAEIEMRKWSRFTVERVAAVLFPWDHGRNPERVEWCAALFAPLMDADPEGFPLARAEFTPPATRQDADHDTMLAASEIVGAWREPDDCADALSSVAYLDRFRLVEDALLAWPAREEIADCLPDAGNAHDMVEVDASPNDADAPEPHSEPLATVEPEDEPRTTETPAARPYSISEARYAKGQMVIHCPCPTGYKTRAAYLAEEIGGRYVGRSKGYHVSRRQAEKFERLYAAGESQDVDATVAAPIVAVEPPAPARKPRYRYSPVSGAWELIEPAGEVERR